MENQVHKCFKAHWKNSDTVQQSTRPLLCLKNSSLFAALEGGAPLKTSKTKNPLRFRATKHATFPFHASWHAGVAWFCTAASVPLHTVRTCLCARIRVCSCVWMTHSLLARGHFDSSLSVDCTEVWQVHHWEQRCAGCSVKQTTHPPHAPQPCLSRAPEKVM